MIEGSVIDGSDLESPSLNVCILSVCFRCRPEGWKGPDEDRPGVLLAEAIEQEADRRGLTVNVLRDVRCMSQCKRACVVAFSGTDKFTYLFGDLDPLRHAADILDAFQLYASREDGFLERFERPDVMRDGILGRVPPLMLAAKQVEPRPRRAKHPLTGDRANTAPSLSPTL
jgi:predicted metal-binding protein